MNLKEQLSDIQNRYIQNEKRMETSSILNDLYNERLNLLIFGIPESGPWEKKQMSITLVKQFLKDALKLQNADNITLVD